MLNLSVILEDTARERPDRAALVLGGQRLSYAAVDAVANQVAGLLRSRGLGPGAKVALSCPNLPYFPIVYFGVLKAGATVVPVNVLLDQAALADQLDRCDAQALFCFEGTPELPIGARAVAAARELDGCRSVFLLPVDPAATESAVPGAELFGAAVAGQPTQFSTVRTEPTDTAAILFGSGTTGRGPRGAELTHQNLLLNALVTDAMFGPAEHDVFLAALPLFHSFGQTTLLNAGFFRRATLVLLPRFDPAAALALLAGEAVTVFAGVPTMYWELLRCAAAGQFDRRAIGATLRHAIAGGAAMPVPLLAAFQQTFGVEVLEGYGLSETSPVASFNRPDRPTRPGSIGMPIWGVEMALVDPDWNEIAGEGPGEIAIRGHNVMKGYYRDQAATDLVLRHGWLRTGDIGRRDRDGYYYVVDRAADVISRNGCVVYPREVEDVLFEHPAVSLAAVLGVPQDGADPQVSAYVIRRPGATASEAELLRWCAERLPEHARPHMVRFRERFPTTSTGKILKRALQ
jgi:long-chain acyl-CoA synthetase